MIAFFRRIVLLLLSDFPPPPSNPTEILFSHIFPFGEGVRRAASWNRRPWCRPRCRPPRRSPRGGAPEAKPREAVKYRLLTDLMGWVTCGLIPKWILGLVSAVGNRGRCRRHPHRPARPRPWRLFPPSGAGAGAGACPLSNWIILFWFFSVVCLNWIKFKQFSFPFFLASAFIFNEFTNQWIGGATRNWFKVVEGGGAGNRCDQWP